MSDERAEWVAVNDMGGVVAGPFESEEEAWKALEGTPQEHIGFAEPAEWHEAESR